MDHFDDKTYVVFFCKFELSVREISPIQLCQLSFCGDPKPENVDKLPNKKLQ